MATYYVDSVGGNDGNAGTSEDAAWKTIGKVNTDGIADNDTLLFKAGTTASDASLTALNGVSGVNVGRYSTGADPVLESDDSIDMVVCADMVSCHFSGIHFKGTEGGTTAKYLVKLDGTGSGNIFEDCLFEGGAVAIAHIGTPAYTGDIIRDCVFEDQWVDSVSTSGTSTLDIQRCKFYRTGKGNVAAGAGDAITAHDTAYFSSTDCYFEECKRGIGVSINTAGANVIDRCEAHITDGTYGFSQQNTSGTGSATVTNTLVVINGAAGYGLSCEQAASATFANCTIINRGTSTSAASFMVNTTGSATISQCVSYALSGAYHINGAGTWNAASDRNDFYPDGSLYSGLDWATFTGVTGSDGDTLRKDPKLPKHSGNGSHSAEMNPSSPCVAYGKVLDIPTTALNGAQRGDGLWDVGAWQVAEWALLGTRRSSNHRSDYAGRGGPGVSMPGAPPIGRGVGGRDPLTS